MAQLIEDRRKREEEIVAERAAREKERVAREREVKMQMEAMQEPSRLANLVVSSRCHCLSGTISRPTW